jgi:oligoribonuclease NrnB/cAMP/cGMP phosphodiesterase (DHH superfamily)
MAAHSYVLYHANCLDGIGAAYAAWKKLGDDNATYIPVQYNKPIPLDTMEPNNDVYIVDFSYPAEELHKLATVMNKVVVLDHHKTALPEIRTAHQLCVVNDIFTFHYRYSELESGAVIAWNYFHPEQEQEVPELLLHIQDRDLWKFKLPNTKEIIAGLTANGLAKLTLARIENLIENWNTGSYYMLLDMGDIINANFNARCKELAEKAYACTLLGDYEGLAINTSMEYASEVGNLLAIKSGTYGAVWTYEGNGVCKVSLRSTGDYDVSTLAQKFGGGGHKNAAGFTVSGFVDITDVIMELREANNER